MPPPTCKNPECLNKYKTSKVINSNTTNNDDLYEKPRYSGVRLVKTLLGPNLEDVVLRTLELGKSIIHQSNDAVETFPAKEKKAKKEIIYKKEYKNQKELYNITIPCKKHMKINNHGHGDQDLRRGRDGRTKKRIVYTANIDKDVNLFSKQNAAKKQPNLTKIRSLDSDLKKMTVSPEKIKRQLEALIQINKDEPPESGSNWKYLKTPKIPVEYTVMPSFTSYKSYNDDPYVSNPNVPKEPEQEDVPETSSSTRRVSSERPQRKRFGVAAGLSQAPEFISNALGPTIDVSIIDNLKLMRDLFKCEQEPPPEPPGDGTFIKKPEPEPSKTSSFRAQPIKSMSQKAALDSPPEFEPEPFTEQVKEVSEVWPEPVEEPPPPAEPEPPPPPPPPKFGPCCPSSTQFTNTLGPCVADGMEGNFEVNDPNYEATYEALKQRIVGEEEKLNKIKEQYDFVRREYSSARDHTLALKRNKSLLDAWDVIASKVCHTKLPSFSRALTLERKQLKTIDDPGDIHCCLINPQGNDSPLPENEEPTMNYCSMCQQTHNFEGCTLGSGVNKRCSKKKEELAYPMQRDITCGLHQTLRLCACGGDGPKRIQTFSSCTDDDLYKKFLPNKNSKKTVNLELNYGKPPIGKLISRSRSETAVKRDKNSKIVKVMWAVTRINIFQDNCRTYEVMDATTIPPSNVPAKTEGIFVVKSAPKKPPNTPRKKINI